MANINKVALLNNGKVVGAGRNKDNSNLAPIEATTTASRSYLVGDYLMLQGEFYKVISAIAIGDTLTVGTNITSTNVGDEIDEVNDKVDALYKLKYFDVTVLSGVNSYNYNNDKPSDFYAPISAISIGGGTCVVSQIGSSTMYFTASLSSSSVVRILYKAK